VNDAQEYVSQGRHAVEAEDWRDAVGFFQAALRIDVEYAQAHLGLGIAYWHLGRTDEAIFEYRTALRLHPSFAEAHFGLGVAYRQQGRLEEAIHHYLVALRLNPVYAQAHYNLGVAYCQQDRWDEAISEFQAVLCITPDDADTRFGLGLAYKQTGHVDQAIREYQFAVRFNPGFSRAHYNLAVASWQKGLKSMAAREAELARELGYEAAGSLLKKMGVTVSREKAARKVQRRKPVEPTLPPAVRKRLDQGLVFLKREEWKKAADVFEELIVGNQDLVEAGIGLARAYAGDLRWDDAAVVLSPLLERHPDNGSAHCLMGQSLAARDRLDEAIEEVRLAESLGFERAGKYLTLLREYQAQQIAAGSVEGAVEPVFPGLVVEPASGEWRVGALVPLEEGRGRIAPGITVVQESQRASVEEAVPPAVGSVPQPSAEAGLTEEPIEGAAPQAEPEIVAAPTSVPAAREHYNRGQELAKLGRWDDAIREFQAAVEEDNGFSDAYVAIGKANVKLNRWGDAVTAFLATLIDSPPDGRSHYYLGLVYAEQGRLVEAGGEAARAQKLGYEPAEELLLRLRTEELVGPADVAAQSLMPQEEPWGFPATLDEADQVGIQPEVQAAPEPQAPPVERSHQGDARYRFEQGVACVRDGEWDDAVSEFEAALELDPTLARARLELGRVYARQERWDDAIDQFRAVVEGNPDDVRAHFYLALAYAERGSFDEAIAEAEWALRLGHEPARSLLERLRRLPGLETGGWAQVTRPVDAASGREGVTLRGGPGQEHFQRGLAAGAQAKWREAVDEFQAALEEMPGFVPARIELGKAYARQRRWDEAAGCFRDALGINPNDADAHYCLGLVHAEKGEWDEATQQFQRALRINPNHAEARKGMGLAYGQKILLAE